MSSFTRRALVVVVITGLASLADVSGLLAAETATEKPAASGRSPELSDAWRKWETARLRVRQYAELEYPLLVRRLDNEIQLTAAELAMHQREVQAFGPSSNFRYSKAFSYTLERAKLAALEAELRLKELQEQRMLLQRGRADKLRLLELEQDAAAERVIELRE